MLKKLALVGGVPALVLPAFAAVPTEVTEAIATAKADAMTVAGLVLAITFALLAFKWIRKASNGG